jgi:hypothetical protein
MAMCIVILNQATRVSFALFLILFFGCNESPKSQTYVAPDRTEYYRDCYNFLLENDDVREFVQNRTTGFLAVYNTDMCNMCQKLKVQEFNQSLYNRSSNVAIVVLSRDKARADDFLKLHNLVYSDSVVFVPTKDMEESSMATKEMVAYEFLSGSFKAFLKQ